MAKSNRIEQEKNTVITMIRLYCKHHHAPKGSNRLCSDCQLLANYAHTRLDHCRFGEKKTFCANCTVHCYKQDMRDNIRTIMRYSGPRMIFRHPFVVIQHVRHVIHKRKRNLNI